MHKNFFNADVETENSNGFLYVPKDSAAVNLRIYYALGSNSAEEAFSQVGTNHFKKFFLMIHGQIKIFFLKPTKPNRFNKILLNGNVILFKKIPSLKYLYIKYINIILRHRIDPRSHNYTCTVANL